MAYETISYGGSGEQGCLRKWFSAHHWMVCGTCDNGFGDSDGRREHPAPARDRFLAGR